MATISKAGTTKAKKKIPVVKVPSTKMAAVNCGKWKASQSGGTKTLTVTGECTVPPGYTVSLRMAVPQGFNPQILLLRKVITAPSRARKGAPVTVQVRYTKRASILYTHVTIEPDGKTVAVTQTA